MDQDAARRGARRAVRGLHGRRIGQALHRDAEGRGALRADDRAARARNRRRLRSGAARGTGAVAHADRRRLEQARGLNHSLNFRLKTDRAAGVINADGHASRDSLATRRRRSISPPSPPLP
ncbi:hypothetical protein BGLA2_240019 [Burkholderia gladioli]|nr:hypothetical protein BGLA2_240019 [Burkholderia gladioli]